MNSSAPVQSQSESDHSVQGCHLFVSSARGGVKRALGGVPGLFCCKQFLRHRSIPLKRKKRFAGDLKKTSGTAMDSVSSILSSPSVLTMPKDPQTLAPTPLNPVQKSRARSSKTKSSSTQEYKTPNRRQVHLGTSSPLQLLGFIGTHSLTTPGAALSPLRTPPWRF